jgi:hypothetical protein
MKRKNGRNNLGRRLFYDDHPEVPGLQNLMEGVHRQHGDRISVLTKVDQKRL